MMPDPRQKPIPIVLFDASTTIPKATTLVVQKAPVTVEPSEPTATSSAPREIEAILSNKGATELQLTSAEEPSSPEIRIVCTVVGETAPFAHAPDYSWLIGKLESGRVPGTWSVRYCPVEEDDPHGGSVTLVAPHLFQDLHVGQSVRVEGGLYGAEPDHLKPSYWARSVTVLQPTAPSRSGKEE
jgi:hypothetical protein